MVANIEEVLSRRGRIIAVASETDSRLETLAEEVLYVPETLPLLSPLLTTIPLQLLAYHCALIRGHDVDKPRNPRQERDGRVAIQSVRHTRQNPRSGLC